VAPIAGLKDAGACGFTRERLVSASYDVTPQGETTTVQINDFKGKLIWQHVYTGERRVRTQATGTGVLVVGEGTCLVMRDDGSVAATDPGVEDAMYSDGTLVSLRSDGRVTWTAL
jgi:hypothetical protein